MDPNKILANAKVRAMLLHAVVMRSIAASLRFLARRS